MNSKDGQQPPLLPVVAIFWVVLPLNLKHTIFFLFISLLVILNVQICSRLPWGILGSPKIYTARHRFIWTGERLCQYRHLSSPFNRWFNLNGHLTHFLPLLIDPYSVLVLIKPILVISELNIQQFVSSRLSRSGFLTNLAIEAYGLYQGPCFLKPGPCFRKPGAVLS